MPDLREWRLLLLAAGSYFFARLSTGELPHVLFYGCTALLVLAWLWTWYAGRRLTVDASVSVRSLHVGGRTELRLRLENSGPLPIPWLEVIWEPVAGAFTAEHPRQALSVGPYRTGVITIPLVASRRGRHGPGRLVIRLGDPFGIFRVQQVVRLSEPVTVYPRVPQLAGIRLPHRYPVGRSRAGRYSPLDPASLAGLRAYEAGDSPRHIHWPTSARRGEWQLKQYEASSTVELAILLDLGGTGHVSGTAGDTLETAVELAAGLAGLAARHDLRAGMWAASSQAWHTVQLARGGRAFAQILEALVEVTAAGGESFADVLQTALPALPRHATLAVITPQPTPAVVQWLAGMRAQYGVALFWVGAPGSDSPEQRLVEWLRSRRIPVFSVPAGSDPAQLSSLAGGWLETDARGSRTGRHPGAAGGLLL